MNAPRRLFISFSGGETSAFLTRLLLSRYAYRWDEIKVVFANTGQEREETLEFVRDCDKAFGFGTVWVEAEIHHGERKSPTARVVDFDTASRNGEPFEEAIKKYGIPNQKFKNCTRNLKINPMVNYLRSVGWDPGTYDTAIGIRADEIDRMSSAQEERRIIYPLISWEPTTKPEINYFWKNESFRLRLKGYEGNCKWCWKKSLRKHLTLLGESPEIYDFPERMEKLYGKVGPEFLKDPATRRSPLAPDYRRVFFRGNVSTKDLREQYLNRKQTFVPAPDDSDVYVEFDPELDVGGGCEESCEVFSDEDEKLVNWIEEPPQ